MMNSHSSTRTLKNSKGSSLIQVIIASGLIMIIGLAVTSTISNLNKEVRALTEKILIKEVETQIKNLLLNNDYCTCLLRSKTFDTTLGSEAIVAADQLTQMPSGYSTGPLDASPCTVNADAVIPAAGTVLPGSTATVESVGLTNMQIVSPSNYKADIEVTFSNTVRAIKGIKTAVQFSIDPAANAITNRPFLACATGGGGGGGGPTTSRASKFGLDPNIWPDYIACIRPGDLKFVFELSVANPVSADREVYYTSGYINSSAFPVYSPMMVFRGTDGSWIFNNVISGTAPCNQSIQALKAAGFTW